MLLRAAWLCPHGGLPREAPVSGYSLVSWRETQGAVVSAHLRILVLSRLVLMPDAGRQTSAMPRYLALLRSVTAASAQDLALPTAHWRSHTAMREGSLQMLHLSSPGTL